MPTIDHWPELLDRRTLIKAAAAGAGALALPGAAFAQGTPRKGGTLRLAMPYNPGRSRSDDRPQPA